MVAVFDFHEILHKFEVFLVVKHSLSLVDSISEEHA